MRGIDGAARPRPNIWIALLGALLLAALAFGLLHSGPNATAPANAAGYGGGSGNGKPACTRPGSNGYSQPCPANVSHVATKPSKYSISTRSSDAHQGE